MSNVIREESRKARKPHRCFGCLETIHPGESYHFSVFIDCGRPNNCHLCEQCQKTSSEYLEYGDEFGEGELKELREYYEPPQVSNWYAKCLECGKEFVANRFHDKCKECEDESKSD